MAEKKLICSECGKAPKKTLKGRLPHGWKRTGPETMCPVCWKAKFFLRAITFAVSGPLKKSDWPELREALQQSWAMGTQLCNWASTELAKADVVRAPNMVKLPPFDAPYLYPEARRLFPALASQTVVALLNTVQRKYNAARYERIWLGRAALQSYKYPVPVPVPGAGYQCDMLKRGEDEVPVVRVRIGDRRWTLLLRGGPEWRRQLNDFLLIVNGEGEQVEGAIGRQVVTASAHRGGFSEKAAGGGQAQFNRLMFKVVAWLPRAPDTLKKKRKAVQLTLATGADYFWKATLDGQAPWIIHADHVRRWVVSHAGRLDHLSEDQKFETRRSRRARRPLNEHRQKVATKQHHRLETWCHTVAALFMQWCVRRKVTRVQYDDADKGFLKDFPWHNLKTLLKDKLNVAGIEFAEVASAAVPSEGCMGARVEATD